jgi:nitroreductase
MDTIEILKTRRSIRKYIQDKVVPQDILEELIDCGRLAATARNEQPWEFVIVTENSIKNQIADLAPNGTFLKDAPILIAVFCKDTKYYLEDGSAATENILLATHALGLGGCWIAGDKKPYCEAVKKLLNVTKEYKLVSMISIGYPESKGERHHKRKLKEVIHWGSFKK